MRFSSCGTYDFRPFHIRSSGQGKRFGFSCLEDCEDLVLISLLIGYSLLRRATREPQRTSYALDRQVSNVNFLVWAPELNHAMSHDQTVTECATGFVLSCNPVVVVGTFPTSFHFMATVSEENLDSKLPHIWMIFVIVDPAVDRVVQGLLYSSDQKLIKYFVYLPVLKQVLSN